MVNNISFGSLKKSKLTNIERVFAETFKPPLEKMNSQENLHQWSEDEFLRRAHLTTDFKGVQDKLDLWRGEILKLAPKLEDNKLWKLFIYNAIQKTDIYYPVFNPQLIISTVQQIVAKVNESQNPFNFMKEYEANLRNYSLDKYFPDKNKQNGWIKFSKDDKNSEIIEDIRNLSLGTKWCTKSKLFAEECMDSGDFYILVKNGKSLLAVRTKNNRTYEIKNKLNKPDYESFVSEIADLQRQFPEIELFRDSVSLWDNF